MWRGRGDKQVFVSRTDRLRTADIPLKSPDWAPEAVLWDRGMGLDVWHEDVRRGKGLGLVLSQKTYSRYKADPVWLPSDMTCFKCQGMELATSS